MTNRVGRAILGAVLLTVASPGFAQYDDLLGADDFAFDSSVIDDKQTHWSDGFKLTLDHSHTRAGEETVREQSSVRLEYESPIAQGWYLALDSRYRYFWGQDALAERRDGAYGRNKWQRAWLQYSKGPCAAKAGRQVLIWGEVEGTFATDIVTPFDYTEQLLTDYGNVRLSQDMVVGECFMDDSQLQIFVTPEAKADVYQHHALSLTLDPLLPPVDLDVEPEAEWGARYKWLGSGFDLSVMYAHLYDNAPTLRIRASSPMVEAALARFNFVGMSASFARGRLLVEMEAGYRDKQLVAFNTEETERYDGVVGFEYTTSGNHVVNGGIWVTHFTHDDVDDPNTEVATVGWRKTWFNDNLVTSLLGNWSSSPEFASVTVLGEYQWNDYLNTSLALGWADLDDSGIAIPAIAPDSSATVSVKLEF